MALISEHNPAWPSWFQRVRDVITEKLGPACAAIEHVGSTAVPGMVAKPVIDLIVVIDTGTLETVKSLLCELGYRHQGDLGISGREAFELTDRGLSAELPPHHLYVCPTDSEELERQIAFRDYLRANPEWVARLSELKRSLCEQHGDDREAYVDGKSAMVREITSLALRDSRGTESA
jgi:GrpB-like predicted nucleotidyltransferase (UPF0157 family)